MPEEDTTLEKLKESFPISQEEAESLLEHLKTSWRSEELVPQPEGYILVPTKRIVEPEHPIRENPGNLKPIAKSIEREGNLQPICLRPLDEEWRKFTPIIGRRRFRACTEILGMKEIPAYIREVEEEEVPSIALEENIFRKNLEPSELLNAMLELRELGYAQKGIAEVVNMSQPEVSTYLRVPELPDDIRDAFFSGNISLEHIKVLLKMKGKSREKLFGRMMEENLSVNDSKAIAKLMTGEFEVPEFFDGEEFESRLGRSVDYKSTSRSARLSVKAENEEKLGEILMEILKVKKIE